MKDLYDQQKTLILRNFIEKVWRYGNKVLSLQSNYKHKDKKETHIRYRIPVLHWHWNSLFFMPLRTNY